MKLLVVDVGNTSTAVGLWSDGRVSHVKHVDGPVAAALDAVKRVVERARPDGAAYVSVVPDRDRRFLALFRRLKLPTAQVSHRDFPAAGLRLDYPHPESIGADRLADAAGAVSRHGAPVLVMDFGTALTAAVVTRDRSLSAQWEHTVVVTPTGCEVLSLSAGAPQPPDFIRSAVT